MMNQTPQTLRAVVNTDGAVILDTCRGEISTLNSTGAYIWEALRRGETVSLIVSRLATETGERPETIELDVQEFIHCLEEKQLLPR
ncbi:PqqD family protein [Terracidiphilus gabretensis]|uniref:PqqD family protein n=1 Tax=Terracidiphilus gabretensis TaxID=1577687 RepID=UPI00071C097F|nr:PqqD family protein [Terracidiphilus gabretensis]